MKLFHYTSHKLVDDILKEGLKINSSKNTIDGEQLGIYVTTDSKMNFFKTLPDTKFKKCVDEIVRIEIDESYFKIAKLDKEFHQFDDWDEELETFECLMLYIDKNISPKDIVSVVTMTDDMINEYSLFGEM